MGARLADLMGLRQPARIRDRTRAAQGGPETLRQRRELGQVLVLAEGATDREDELRLADVHVGGRCRQVVDVAAGAGHRARVDRERNDRSTPVLGRSLEGGAAQRQHDHRLLGKGEVHGDLAAVTAAARDHLAAVHRESEHIGGEARAQPTGDRRPEGHAGGGVADEDEAGLALFGDRAHRLLVERGIEVRLGQRDGHDLVDAGAIGGGGERLRLVTDDEDGERTAEAGLHLGRGADHLQRDIAQEPVEVLGDDENAGHQPSPRFSRMIPAMALATAAASPSIIAARPLLGGS